MLPPSPTLHNIGLLQVFTYSEDFVPSSITSLKKVDITVDYTPYWLADAVPVVANFFAANTV